MAWKMHCDVCDEIIKPVDGENAHFTMRVYDSKNTPVKALEQVCPACIAAANLGLERRLDSLKKVDGRQA